MNRMSAPDRSQPRGQALVEFALVFPLIVLMLFGIFDLGRAVYAYNTIGNAARVGARVAAVNQIQTSPDCNESRPVEDQSNPHWSIKTCAAASAVSLGVQTGDVTVSYSAPPSTALTCPQDTPKVGCVASVTVTYTYQPMTPVISSLFSTISMASTSQVPIERVFP